MRGLITALLVWFVSFFGMTQTGPYHPAATEVGSNAVDAQSNFIEAWATGIEVTRGKQDITASNSPLASVGIESDGLGQADGSFVSLGDGGSAILTFNNPITNKPGYDIAVFENALFDQQEQKYFLELATVSVSSDGVNFFMFSPHSLIDTATQIGPFGTADPTYINNLAGKYAPGQGTPFDLDELSGLQGLDIMNITHVLVTDVVGSIDPAWATYDTAGNPINDPFPTAFASCGFDLDAVAVVNQNVGIESTTLPNWISLQTQQHHFYVKVNQQFNLAVYSITGELMYQANLPQGEHNIPHTITNAGVYIVRVSTNSEFYTTKCVIGY